MSLWRRKKLPQSRPAGLTRRQGQEPGVLALQIVAVAATLAAEQDPLRARRQLAEREPGLAGIDERVAAARVAPGPARPDHHQRPFGGEDRRRQPHPPHEEWPLD